MPKAPAPGRAQSTAVPCCNWRISVWRWPYACSGASSGIRAAQEPPGSHACGFVQYRSSSQTSKDSFAQNSLCWSMLLDQVKWIMRMLQQPAIFQYFICTVEGIMSPASAWQQDCLNTSASHDVSHISCSFLCSQSQPHSAASSGPHLSPESQASLFRPSRLPNSPYHRHEREHHAMIATHHVLFRCQLHRNLAGARSLYRDQEKALTTR